jgi:hypothetical protein
MAGRRVAALLSLVLLTGGGVFLLHGCLGSSADRVRVRARYEAMEAALRIGDTNAARLLFAPAHRARAQDNFGRLTTFARPLGLKSAISIDGTRATVCPERIFPIGMFGHTVEMIKVDGEWYFTGKISVF